MFDEITAHRTALAVALFLIAIGISENTCLPHRAHGQAPLDTSWTREETGLSVLITNEASLPRRTLTIDGPMIGWISRARAAFQHLTVIEYIRRWHTRHTRTTRTNRRWILGLSATLERPEGWTDQDGTWGDGGPRDGQRRWLARLRETRLILQGRLDPICPAAMPSDWGGPVVDAQQILAKLNAGTHRIVAGPHVAGEPESGRRADEQCRVLDVTASHNVYLARVRDLDRAHARAAQ